MGAVGSRRRSHFVDLLPSAWPGLVLLFNPSSLSSVLIRAHLAGILSTACSGCRPTDEFLIGQTASPSEVHKVETASGETLKNKNIWQTDSIRCDTFFGLSVCLISFITPAFPALTSLKPARGPSGRLPRTLTVFFAHAFYGPPAFISFIVLLQLTLCYFDLVTINVCPDSIINSVYLQDLQEQEAQAIV